MDTKVSLTDDHAAYPEAVVKNGKIEFQNVSFRYYKDSAEKVLDQINLTIEPGQMIGIIGSTGCGKTTLVSMIPRLYDVDEGKVLVDGIPESSAGGRWYGAAEKCTLFRYDRRKSAVGR